MQDENKAEASQEISKGFFANLKSKSEQFKFYCLFQDKARELIEGGRISDFDSIIKESREFAISHFAL